MIHSSKKESKEFIKTVKNDTSSFCGFLETQVLRDKESTTHMPRSHSAIPPEPKDWEGLGRRNSTVGRENRGNPLQEEIPQPHPLIEATLAQECGGFLHLLGN